MYIEVKIPFDQNCQLASAYNRALSEGTSEWVLFLDHDVFLCCNPHWYQMCVIAIKSLESDPKAVSIGCIAGGETHKRGRADVLSRSDSIGEHIKLAQKAYNDHGNKLVRLEKHVTGFFLLLNRKIALEIGFRQQRLGRIGNIDIDFGERALAAGYHNYLMRGLHVYHRRRISKMNKYTLK